MGDIGAWVPGFYLSQFIIIIIIIIIIFVIIIVIIIVIDVNINSLQCRSIYERGRNRSSGISTNYRQKKEYFQTFKWRICLC
jgi:flagellar basal body-associated protein FliL